MNVTGGCLVVTFTESRNAREALEFQKEVFERSILCKTRGIIFDVSEIFFMDSFMSQNLVNICRAGLFLGRKTVVVGIKPAVAASIVDLGIDLNGISAAVNIEEAIAMIDALTVESEPLQEEAGTLEKEIEIDEADEDETLEASGNFSE